MSKKGKAVAAGAAQGTWRDVVRMAIGGMRNGEIAKALRADVRWVAEITETHSNLIAARRYEREGRRPDGTPLPRKGE